MLATPFPGKGVASQGGLRSARYLSSILLIGPDSLVCSLGSRRRIHWRRALVLIAHVAYLSLRPTCQRPGARAVHKTTSKELRSHLDLSPIWSHNHLSLLQLCSPVPMPAPKHQPAAKHKLKKSARGVAKPRPKPKMKAKAKRTSATNECHEFGLAMEGEGGRKGHLHWESL